MPDLYEMVLTTLLELRDTADHFRIRSAQDIKKLIWSKLEGVRELKDLQLLYKLEAMITDLRQSLNSAKEELEA